LTRRWACGAALLALAAAPATPTPPQQNLALAPGAPVESALTAAETRTFTARLDPRQTYLLAVEQRGIEAGVEVKDAAGKSVAAVLGPLDRWGVETIVLHPPAAGLYTVEVRSERKGVGPGRVLVRLDELPAATPAERERIAALTATGTAGAALRRQTSESLGQALAALQEARGRFSAAGDRRGEAEAANWLAAVSRQAGQQRKAAELFREVAARWHELNEPERELRAWSDLSLSLWEQSDLPGAEEALAHGRSLAQAPYDQADLRNRECVIIHARGDVRAALGCYREALEMFQRLGESADAAAVLNNLGFAAYSLGEPGPAAESYRQALEIRRANENPAGQAQALNNLAVLARSLGEVDSALANYAAAREILASLNDRRQEAIALNNLGVAYSSLGEVERARVYLEKALEMRRAVEDRRGEVVTLDNLGRLELDQNEPGKAIVLYRRALDLALATGDKRAEGTARSYLGEALLAAGQPGASIAELDRALALHRAAEDRPGEALSLRRKAEALAAAGRPAEALPLLAQALPAVRSLGDPVGEAAVLTAEARVRRDSGQLEAAREDALAAVTAIAAGESLRARLGNPELRASFLGSRREAGEILVDVLMRLDAAHPGQGFDRAALEASERARARTLLDVLRESGSTIRNTVDPALAARYRDLEQRLALKADRRQSLLARGAAGQRDAKALDLEIEQVRADLDRLDIEVRRQDPHYAALTRPGDADATGAGEIQALLDAGTVLLEYSLGRERSFLWIVSPSSLRAVTLPGREEIERAARSFHEVMSRPPSSGEGSRLGAGAALSRLLLGPVAGEIRDRRLAIVADGALHYIPFDVLPEPGPKPGEDAEPLLVRHEVVELPSASVLAAQRRELAERRPATRLAAVLADPVFQQDDPRIKAAASARWSEGTREPGALFSRLYFSRREALAISSLATKDAVTTALDFAASRGFALSGTLRDYRYIHFATHGVFDADRPGLSGLVLSRFDAQGRPEEGFLGLRDLYGLDLAADLVVLSGCRTALGKEVRGEGLLGLTRGFFYAGARRVVASLWAVDDQATAELMAGFYRGLWTETLRPADALRQARLSLLRKRRYRDPFYWGAFVLQGDWR
jgi:CHAT domain-containing protein/Tfp pilus assembly protein PilF